MIPYQHSGTTIINKISITLTLIKYINIIIIAIISRVISEEELTQFSTPLSPSVITLLIFPSFIDSPTIPITTSDDTAIASQSANQLLKIQILPKPETEATFPYMKVYKRWHISSIYHTWVECIDSIPECWLPTVQDRSSTIRDNPVNARRPNIHIQLQAAETARWAGRRYNRRPLPRGYRQEKRQLMRWAGSAGIRWHAHWRRITLSFWLWVMWIITLEVW